MKKLIFAALILLVSCKKETTQQQVKQQPVYIRVSYGSDTTVIYVR